MEFKDYKDKQSHYRDLYKNRARLFYDSGKKIGIFGYVIKKGIPFRKEK